MYNENRTFPLLVKRREGMIKKCENSHFFVGKECPHCHSAVVAKAVEHREGDCIDCGNLCPGNAPGCAGGYFPASAIELARAPC